MVVTFYSYKGGVGRSMALANVAEVLAGFGYRVIVCDWDLEAPGLERYFVANNAAEETYRRSMDQFLGWPGLVDLLVEYKETLSRPDDPTGQASRDSYGFTQHGAIWLRRPSSYALTPDNQRTGPGSLRLLTAGRRFGENRRHYGEAVRQFDWQQFYDQWAGDAYMDFFRQDFVGEKGLDGAADLLLIDSRTGVTEQGGVCTHHLADLVLVLTAANDLNMEGARWMVQTLGDPQLVKARSGRPLAVLPIASRIEQTAQTKELVEFRRQFIREFGPALAKHTTDPEALAIATEIPYMPYFSYHERVVAREPEGDREQNLYSKYRAIADAIVDYGVRMQLLRERTAEGITARAADQSRRAEPSWNHATFLEELRQQLDARDPEAVSRMIDALERELHARADPFPEADADDILELIERKRQFAALQAGAEAFIRAGLNHPALRLVYARSLIEQGNATVALSILPALVTETAKDPEINTPARMMIGRIFKDQYLESPERSTAKAVRNLERAVNEYYGLYRQDPENLRAGIHVAGLVARAKRDGIQLTDAPATETVSADVLRAIQARRAPTAAGDADWFLNALAVEACLAVGHHTAATAFLIDFTNDARVDDFSLANLRRQLTAVWGLTFDAEPGISMLGVIDGAILIREDGRVVIDTNVLSDVVAATTRSRGELEATFGADPLRSLRWFQQGLHYTGAVVRIGSDRGTTFGTGFLIAGALLHPSLGQGHVLITTAHVLSPHASVADALRPSVATVVRTGAADRHLVHRVAEVVFTSPPNALDVTIATLDPPVTDAPGLTLALAGDVPAPQRLVLIGHNASKDLILSCGRMLDRNESVVLHRCATVRETSGSPIFDDQWRVVAMHHAAKPLAELPWTSIGGTGDVNEGVQIAAIAREVGRAMVRQRPPKRRQRQVRVFVSYSGTDQSLAEELQRHLILTTMHFVFVPDDRQVDNTQGTSRLRRLAGEADVFLLLVSADYLAATFISLELPNVLQRAARGVAAAIPVIVRETHWLDSPFGHLQALPQNGTPVVEWSNRDAAWASVVEGVMTAIDGLSFAEPHSTTQQDTG